nr:DivIVA domain-containing protein [uncultured Cellulomonas sp.]
MDDFLDRVAETLKEQEGLGRARNPVTASQLEAARFQTTKWREGYDQQEVDAFLDRVRDRLASDAPASTPAREPSPTSATPVDGGSIGASTTLSGAALVVRLQSVRATRPAGAPDVVVVRLPDGTVHPVTDLRSTADGVELTLG